MSLAIGLAVWAVAYVVLALTAEKNFMVLPAACLVLALLG